MAVDDAKDSLMLLEFDLSEVGYRVVTANSGEAALALMEHTDVSLVLLDMYMPGISGFETLRKIKANENYDHIPVIMLSTSDDEDQVVKALELGASDYVTKPYIAKILLARIKIALTVMEKTILLESLANTDFLTKVSNRGSFEELVSKSISQAKRSEQMVSLAMFDLDFFKKVNDNYGHEAGDLALVEFSRLLKQTFRDYDIIGRVGGEEFAVCMPNTSLEEAFVACERCRQRLMEQTIKIEQNGHSQSFNITVSIGLTAATGSTMTFDSLLREADHLLYQAKENGRNQTCVANKIKDGSEDGGIDMTNTEHSDTTEKRKCFAGIDYDIGVNNVLGDDNLFADILVMFYQDHGCYPDEIQQAITTNEQETLKHLVHTLKGVACSIGAMQLFELCKSLDFAINEQHTARYQALFEPVRNELELILTGIKEGLADKL